jgi:hypothetical protein
MSPCKLYIDNFRKTLLNHIKAIDSSCEEEKENVARSMYEYIIKNKYALEHGDNAVVYQILKDKLDDMHYIMRIPWASNYYLLIFGNALVEDINGIPELIEIEN